MNKLLCNLLHPVPAIIGRAQNRQLWIPDRLFLKLQFRHIMGYRLNLRNPETFNEKIQWLKIWDRKPVYTELVDKAAVKAFVRKKIGDKYVIPTYGVFNDFDEINFDKLPESFVIKTTHYGGGDGVFIVKNKKDVDRNVIKRAIEKILKKNLYYYSREWPYKNVKPRIIIEEYVGELGGSGDVDYKMMCFNGRVKCIFTCTERFTKNGLKVTFFDTNWNLLPFERSHPRSEKIIPEPPNLKKMIELSERLSKGIPFVRVDFYNPRSGCIKFGEMTLYPGAGLEKFTPKEWDRKLGDLIMLPRGDKR